MLRVLARLSEEGPATIVPTLLAAHTVPPEFAERREEYVRWIAEELIPEVAAAGLAQFCDAFCDDHAFTVEETRTVLTAARRHGLRLRVHAEQFRPGTGAALAAELGAATADHLETVTEETLRQLRTAGVQPVLLPGSVFALGRTKLSAGARDGRAGVGDCGGHGLQSRLVADCVDAVCDVAGLPSDGTYARRGAYRGNHQRGLEPGAWKPRGISRNRQTSRFSDS